MSTFLRVILRTLIFVIAFGGLYWSYMVIRSEYAYWQYEQVAKDISDGNKFEKRYLERLAPIVDKVVATEKICRSDVPRLAATIYLALFEAEVQLSRFSEANSWLEKAHNATVKSLECAPLQGNLWLQRSQIESVLAGYSDKAHEYLKMSFTTAPMEGWVIRRRTLFALRLIDTLDDEMKEKLAHDYSQLLSGYMWRDAIVAYSLSPQQGKAFAEKLIDQANPQDKDRFWFHYKRWGFSKVPQTPFGTMQTIKP